MELSEYYTEDLFRKEARAFLDLVAPCQSMEQARERLFNRVTRHQFDTHAEESPIPFGFAVRVRDSARTFQSVLKMRSDKLTGFSVTKVFWDLAKGNPRPDLGSGFFAEMIHLIYGLEARALNERFGDFPVTEPLTGREAAEVRSDELDRLSSHIEAVISRYSHGLRASARSRRVRNRHRILDQLKGDEKDWNNWQWHIGNIVMDADLLGSLINIDEEGLETVRAALDSNIPFGITPFYLSLLDNHFEGKDRALRAQVLPPSDYVEEMTQDLADRDCVFDFMLERDTSPTDHITRRYPNIVILKPIRTCPQICVYCQRNWEIETANQADAVTSKKELEQAIRWIEANPSIIEILITGGDPLMLDDEWLEWLLSRISRINHIDMIRIGSRMLVTLPSRITDNLADLLGSYRLPGVRDICIMTHLEHPYELSEELITSVQKLRMRGISIYNQLVYTFYISRRFEASLLRRLLRRIGIDPYYTFITKGKEETGQYRVPIARLLQEQKEEARSLPGTRRTDEAVYNVPGLGKNYLRAIQHRDILTITPRGARIYEFHPWEKNIIEQKTFIQEDIPILDYLDRLAALGENPDDYESIWYYY
ncbi:KamA family radical SAM protein [Acidobacteriota bacterium]